MDRITLEDVRKNPVIESLVHGANEALAALGYTEHGPRHVGFVSAESATLLLKLGYDERTAELAAIAGWIHDVGNVVNRHNHGMNGATMLLPILREIGLPMNEVITILGAVGNHEEQNGTPISPVSSAVIIADKSDAHRTRVRRGKFDPNDIHDVVNYAIRENRVEADRENRVIRFSMTMDDTASTMDFLHIYMSRMLMCEKAAGLLGCRFEMVVNGFVVNRK